MNQLCFQVSEFDLTYSIIDRASKQIIKAATCKLSGRVTELKKDEATDFLRKEDLLDFDGEVSLSYFGPRTTLVPQIIYGESSSKDIFDLSFGTTEHSIEHTRFFEQALVNVYEIEEWIKRFFVIRYPRVNIQHETTHLLRGIFEKNTFQPTVHLSAKGNHFFLFAVSKNQLDFFNTFEFTNTEDLLYYTLHTVNNLNYNSKDWSLVLHSDTSAQLDFDTFSDQLKHSSKKQSMDIRHVSQIKHQLLCV
jgi:hypothetical protein